MYFLLGREIGNGYYDFVSDIEQMTLIDDPSHAQQISEAELDMLDMDYLMEQNFFAMEIDRFGLRFSKVLLFRPPMAHYRPPVMPKKAGDMIVRPPRHMQPHKPAPRDGKPRPAGRPAPERRSGPDVRPARLDGEPGERPEGRTGGRFSSFVSKPGRRPRATGRPGGSGNSEGYRGKPGGSGNSDGYRGRPGGSGNSEGYRGSPGGSGNSEGYRGKPGGSGNSDGYRGKPGGSGNSEGYRGRPGGSGKSGGFRGKPGAGRPGTSPRPGGRDPHRGGGNRGGRA